MIALLHKMLDKQNHLELRGEPWLQHVDAIIASGEFNYVKLPVAEYKPNSSIDKMVACWVRNGQCSLLMELAAELNDETMLDELSNNYITIDSLKRTIPRAVLYLRAYGIIKNRIDFAKSGAGIRITRKCLSRL
jgi:hypothetical protein